MGLPLEVEKSGLPLLLGELASVCFFMRAFFGGDALLLGEVFFWITGDESCGLVVDDRDLGEG